MPSSNGARKTHSASCGHPAITPHPIAAWASASSTMWPSRRVTRSGTASSACSSRIGTYTTATARRISSTPLARPCSDLFCIFNNVAIAARYAQRHGIERVLIADWDVHHGNGTQDIFYADGSVFFFSTHQHPWYPGTGRPDETGAGVGPGATLNCPFPAGAGRAEILGAFQDRLLPAARDFQPDLVLISAGFDSRLGDPLGRFTLSDADFTDLTTLMLEVADTYAGGRLVSVLEGGYSLEGLASAAVAHVSALRGADL